jgi:hypothetical protein
MLDFLLRKEVESIDFVKDSQKLDKNWSFLIVLFFKLKI